MHNPETVYELVKSRLDRGGVSVPAAQEAYWKSRIEAAAMDLQRKGISLQDDADDNMLLADYAVYRIQNRDKDAGEPQWLRLAIRERWLSLKGREVNVT